ncbi:hypothetical protein C8J56DRAFT_1043228 [Mycena floridula]|nr:hypothetical protein C8J56DRAFT_1043228 [Mycena floridula]
MFSFQFWDRVKGMTTITTLVLGNMSGLWVLRQIQLPTVTRLSVTLASFWKRDQLISMGELINACPNAYILGLGAEPVADEWRSHCALATEDLSHTGPVSCLELYRCSRDVSLLLNLVEQRKSLVGIHHLLYAYNITSQFSALLALLPLSLTIIKVPIDLSVLHNLKVLWVTVYQAQLEEFYAFMEQFRVTNQLRELVFELVFFDEPLILDNPLMCDPNIRLLQFLRSVLQHLTISSTTRVKVVHCGLDYYLCPGLPGR